MLHPYEDQIKRLVTGLILDHGNMNQEQPDMSLRNTVISALNMMKEARIYPPSTRIEESRDGGSVEVEIAFLDHEYEPLTFTVHYTQTRAIASAIFRTIEEYLGDKNNKVGLLQLVKNKLAELGIVEGSTVTVGESPHSDGHRTIQVNIYLTGLSFDTTKPIVVKYDTRKQERMSVQQAAA